MRAKLAKILNEAGLTEYLPRFEAEAVDDDLLDQLDDQDLVRLGITKLGHRKILLAAFAAAGFAHPILAQIAATPPPPQGAPMRVQHDRCFNSLGLPFVPVPAVNGLFCTWPARVRDFDVFTAETGASIPSPDFSQTPDHPVVMVTWDEANAFCDWLTKRESRLGLLPSHLRYRLPEDIEWSKAVGLTTEVRPTPKERSGRVKGYPWGGTFPPPPGAGNYHPSLRVDAFRETSPVGSFAANNLGIHDLGGNVWEWCQDHFDQYGSLRTLRGASCFNDDEEFLLSSYRDKGAPTARRNNNGFRLLLAATGGRAVVWH